ncbi:MAG: HPP family protein [Campylobacterales bacterium]|nr:HPP family protein [Campylobacterales bacterium]
MNYLNKFRGKNTPIPPRAKLSEIAFAWFGGFIAITLIGYLTQEYNNLFIMGSFGASCVLIFGFLQSPFSQPRNIVAGHLFSTFIGLLFLHFVGDTWWSMALALATAIAVMMITRTVHPPAGSNPLIVFLVSANWDYLIFPSLAGSLLLTVVALIFNNLHSKRIYPEYW